MRKVVFLFDPINFDAKQLEFPISIAATDNSVLTGICFENEAMEAVPTIKTFGGQIYIEEITPNAQERRQYHKSVNHGIDLFKSVCEQKGITANVHIEQTPALEAVIRHSRYADLLMVDPRMCLLKDKDVPSDFVMKVLADSECPVLITPEVYVPIEEVVLTYDNSMSSVFAIKQFSYHLPALATKKIKVLHVKENNDGKEEAEVAAEFKEWLDAHFTNVSFIHMTGNVRESILNYFLGEGRQNRQLLVTGAFGRSVLSSFFKPSTAEMVLKTVDIPAFIAHG